MNRYALISAAVSFAACAESTTPVAGPGFEIKVAPLTLPGVADACYDLAVYNVAKNAIGPAALVWSEDDVCADRYGDGRGAITYVGTCDASPSGRIHTVSLALDGLCAQNGCDPTDDEDPNTIDSDTWQNPCPASAPCLLERPCTENADTLVEFNLTILRDANQGFFDVAVNFEDVFCSAKLDCVPELLHRPGPDGARDLTAVLGFACTSGAANTCLYANALTLDCGGANVWTLDPSQGPGRITENSPLLYGAAVYAGDEAFTAFEKSYWNLALGLDETQFANFPNCTLRWTTTASETPLAGTGPFSTPAGSYPFIAWERDILVNGNLACWAHPINVTLDGEDEPAVSTAYTELDTPAAFAFTNCEPGTPCICPSGFTPNPAGDGCSRTTTVNATPPTTTYNVCAGDSNAAYSQHGTRFTTSTVAADFEIPEGGSTTATCTDPNVCITDSTLQIGHLSTIGVWACPPADPLNTYIGFSQCIDLAASGVYLVGIAGDNAVRLEVDGNLVYQSASSLNFRTWNVLRVPLTSGQHIIELFGMDQGVAAAFGAEIWGPFTAAQVSTPAAMRTTYLAAIAEAGQPKRVFSTQPLRTANPVETFDTSVDGSSGYSCPTPPSTTPYALNLCGATPQCTLFETRLCGDDDK